VKVIEVQDAADERLVEYTRLRDVSLRKSFEAEHGLFLAEGATVIRRALAAGYRPRSLLLTARRLPALQDVLDSVPADTPVFTTGDEVARQVAGFPVHRGALASFHREPPGDLDTVLARARRIVVLEDVVDHTNVGAIFRCAAGLGLDAAVLAPRCADPLYRRAVKVSMGAVFTLAYTRLPDWHGGLGELRRRGFRLLALTPDAQATRLDHALSDVGERVALLLGTEGDGLSARWLGEADQAVRIPMATGDVDSLNVTAAAAIACYELSRR
jgi:tRNA G18 (ribose-2'-O)-methylase SpoU